MLIDPEKNYNRHTRYKHLAIYKNKKAYYKILAEEEDCKRGDTHAILDMITPKMNNGVMKNPFNLLNSSRFGDFKKSITIEISVIRKRKDSRTSFFSDYDQNEPSESTSEHH